MNTTEQFIYLCACACSGRTASLDSADFDSLWQTANNHNMTALTAKALEGTEALQNADPAEQKRWRNALDNNIKKTMLFTAERKKLLAFLEERGIWYMPLKGAVINSLYPHFGTREFADNDILTDPDRMEESKEWMLSRGYAIRQDDFEAYEYSKPPFYNFELHFTLIELSHMPLRFEVFLDYYKNVKERLLKDEENGYGYHFSDDDFYIYFIFHAYKHYDIHGTGFRTVADEYVLLHSDRFHFDFRAIKRELTRLGIADFEEKLRILAETLFTEPENTHENLLSLDGSLRETLTYILSAGTFGKEDLDSIFAKEFAESAGEKPSKVKYYFKRVFPDRSRYKYSHPFVYKHKAVYPFFWVYRTAVYPIKNRRYLRQEVKSIKKIKK